MKTHIRFTRSLLFRLFLSFCFVILLLILSNWIFNRFTWNGFYENSKRTSLTNLFQIINDAKRDRNELVHELSAHEHKEPVSIQVWDEFQLLYTTERHENPPFGIRKPLKMNNGTYQFRIDRDKDGNAVFLTLYGRTDTGINVELSTALAGVPEHTAIADRFLLWSIIAGIIIGVIVFLFLNHIFSKPIRRLSEMAQNMTAMDFSNRYSVKGEDELSNLGQSLNSVSETMESTLSELKTANTRLLDDMEQTERQNEARRHFISNVSHELKTPIALIQTYAEGLRENIADDAAGRDFYCQVIEEEAENLSQTITKMTMLMQLESGKAQLQINRFNIAELTEHLLERYEPLFRERNVLLPVVPQDLPAVWGDASLIENVLTNYLTNALHHVEENGNITFSFGVKPEALRITVENSGSHLQDEDISHIWESFYKVDKAHARTYGGTGIGLSVVAAIMNAHRMPYGVYNTENGVAFYIELPTQ